MKREHSMRYFSIVFLGLVFAAGLTLLAWLQNWTPLRTPAWLYIALLAACALAAMGCGYFLYQRQSFPARPWVFLSCLAVGIASLAIAIPVLAATWTGPSRSTTTSSNERKECYYTADVTVLGVHYGCHLYLYTTPSGACPSAGSTAGLFNAGPCGWPAGLSCTTDPCSIGGPSTSIVGCSTGQTGCTSVSHTTNLSPATISGSTSCDSTMINGWCPSAAHLNLSANEPDPLSAGWTITGIASDLVDNICGGNGTESLTCPWDFPEGSTTLNFWALSSHGDQSNQSSASMKVDTVKPSLTFLIPAPDGQNGWFVSPVTVSALASDGTSGVPSGNWGVSLDGATWPHSLSLPADGVYTVYAFAVDAAGNAADTLSRNIQIDATQPTLAVTQPPATGTGGWYVTSPVQVSAVAGDATSGLPTDGLKYSVDGGLLQPGNLATISGDGTHTITFQAVDLAGNTTAETRTLNVDTAAAQLSLSGRTGFCRDCGEHLTLTYSVQDGGSGVASWTLSADSTLLVSGSAAASSTYDWNGDNFFLGPHTITLEARDAAGNLVQAILNISLDGVPQPEATATGLILHPLPPTPGPASTTEPQSPSTTAPTATRVVAVIIPTSASGNGGNTSGSSQSGSGGSNSGSSQSGTGGNSSGSSQTGTGGNGTGTAKSGNGGNTSTSSQPSQSLPPSVPLGAAAGAVATGLVSTYILDQRKRDKEKGGEEGSTSYDPLDPLTLSDYYRELGEPGVQRMTGRLITAPFSAMASAADSISDTLQSIRNKTFDINVSLGNTLDRVDGFLNGVSSRITSWVDDFGASLDNSTADLNRWAGGEISAGELLRRTANGIVDDAKSFGRNIWESISGRNSQAFDDTVGTVGFLGTGLSLTGMALESITGDKRYKGLADAGSLISSASDLLSLRGTFIDMIEGVAPEVTAIGKFGGVLAVVLSPFAIAGGINEIRSDYAQNGRLTIDSAPGFLDAASGVCALLGGGATLTGIGAPAAPFLFAASGVLAGASWVVKNRDGISNFIQTGLNAWAGMPAQIKTIAEKLPGYVTHQVSQAVSSAAAAVSTAVSNVANAVKNTVSNVANTVKNTVSNVANAVKNTVSNVANAVKNTVSNVANTVKNTVSNVANAVKNTVSNVANTVKSTISNAVNTVKDTAKNVISNVSNAVQNIVSSPAVKTVTQTVSNVAKAVSQTVTKTVQAAAQTVTKAAQTVTQTVTKAAQSVTQAVGNTVKNIFKGLFGH